MKTATRQTKNVDLGHDLVITTSAKDLKKARDVGGVWIDGRIAGHRFQALVFSDHADSETYELGTSKISKLGLQRLDDKKQVAHFDRGWDVKPTTDLATAIVDFLAAGLSDLIYA